MNLNSPEIEKLFEEMAKKDPLELVNADEQTQKIFDEAIREAKEDAVKNAMKDADYAKKYGELPNIIKSQDGNVSDEDGEENHGNGENSDGNGSSAHADTEDFNCMDEEEWNQFTDSYQPRDSKISAKGKRIADGQYDEAVASLKKWLYKNRRKGLTLFENYENGYLVFTTFEKENPYNMKWDGLLDKKTGELKSRFECKYLIKRNKKGILEINFALPSGGKLTLDHVDRIMDAYVDAGIRRVKFGKMRDDYEAIMRFGCGKAMIVPVDHKLTKKRIDLMIAEAEKKHGENNPQVIRYKFELAKQLAYQLKTKGKDAYDLANKNDADCRAVRHLTQNYKFAPFRDLWEDFNLRDTLEDTIKKNNTASGSKDGASEIVGSAMAVSKLYKMYFTCVTNPYAKYGMVKTEYLLSDANRFLSSEQKAEFAKHVDAGSAKKLVRDMDPKLMMKLFDIIKVDEVDNARFKINEEYSRLTQSSQFSSESKERQAVKRFIGIAGQELAEVAGNIKDFQLPDMYIPKLMDPEHDYESKLSNKELEWKMQGKPGFKKPSDKDKDDKGKGGRPSSRGYNGYE
jgi:hypothetical protein